jgi:GT2 family glycosyltransferase
MDHISIIIVNYNGDKDTHGCLKSLDKVEETRDFKFNVIVVDNASQEPFTLTTHEKKQEVALLRVDSNLGFTGGNNLGIKHARDKFNSDFFLLLNNDTTVDPGFLKNLYKCAKSNPKAGLINSKVYFTKGNEFHKKSYKKNELGNVLWFGGGSIDWRNLVAFHRGIDEVDRGQFDDQTEGQDFATGCSMLLRRELVETIGLLNDDLFLYMEDVEYSLRAKRAGF